LWCEYAAESIHKNFGVAAYLPCVNWRSQDNDITLLKGIVGTVHIVFHHTLSSRPAGPASHAVIDGKIGKFQKFSLSTCLVSPGKYFSHQFLSIPVFSRAAVNANYFHKHHLSFLGPIEIFIG
jgi:hypothetical protein